SLNRFRTGDKDLWPSQQWAVLDDFQRAYLDREIKRIGGECLDDAICMFGLAGWPLNELFEQVSAQSDRILAERFFSDWCVGRPSIWITAFWEQPGNTEAFNFYTSRDLYERMEALALDEGTDPELAEKALSVASVIQSNADWAQPG
ncbi:MAG: hypothetical protein OXQ92_16965, partial [Boseongicola sp.]|nr:hypothetical protein [Boseongicola sp.]